MLFMWPHVTFLTHKRTVLFRISDIKLTLWYNRCFHSKASLISSHRVCTSETAIAEQGWLPSWIWREQWMGCWNICGIKLWLFQWIPSCSGMRMWQTSAFHLWSRLWINKKICEKAALHMKKIASFTVKPVKAGMKNQLLPGDMGYIWKTEWRLTDWFMI